MEALVQKVRIAIGALILATAACAAPDGPQGNDGLPGAMGTPGANGENGINGANGEAGPPGQRGDPGSSVGFPAGVIIAFGGTSASVPAGWVLCDGHAESRSTEATLFAVIGTLHGGGDGTTTFNVPDMRGRFPRGLDTSGLSRDPDVASRTGAPNGGATGTQVGSLQGTATKFPNNAFVNSTNGAHTHGANNAFAYGGLVSGAPAQFGNGSNYFYPIQTESAGDHSHMISGGDNESRPANLAVNYIIKL